LLILLPHLTRGLACSKSLVARPTDSYLPTAPRMPATMPRTAPAMKPPPMKRLVTAKGKVIEAPITPRLITIIIPPDITANPATKPIKTAIDCPSPDGPPSHQNIADQ